jgi:signal transduction histidine kinase
VRVTGSHPERPHEARRPARPISQSEIAWLVLALLCLIAIVVLLAWHVVRFTGIWDSLPALAVIFVAFAWQANRASVALDRASLAAEAERLLLLRRQVMQDAARQLRTPITIALGHAELLAAALTGPREPDIRVVVAQLKRLQAVSERLLAVAAAESPGYLPPEPASLAGQGSPATHAPQPVHAPAATQGPPASAASLSDARPARVSP